MLSDQVEPGSASNDAVGLDNLDNVVTSTRRPRRGAVLAAISLAVLVVPVGSPVASADAKRTTEMVKMVNELRAAYGLRVLSADPGLQRSADRWANNMAREGRIFHNLNLGTEVTSNWSKIGENVGTGFELGAIQDAFEASPAHLRNLVDPRWDGIGIAVVETADGELFVAQHFQDLRDPVGAATPATRTSKQRKGPK